MIQMLQFHLSRKRKSMDSGAKLPGLKFWLCLLLSVQLAQVNCLSDLMYKIEIVKIEIIPTS